MQTYNEVFIRGKFPGRPRVVANFALTWDGRISTRNLTPSDFSSPTDKARLLEIRAEGDAVMASATTVRADTMTMGLPLESLREARVSRGQEALPLRVIWTRGGNIPTGLKFFHKPGAPVVIFSGSGMSSKNRTALEKYATVWQGSSAAPSPLWALDTLAQRHNVKKLILEGGGTLFQLFLACQCVDELCLTWCPRIFGGRTGITLTGLPGAFLPLSVRALLSRVERNGAECFTRWRLKYNCNFSGKH